ncbi:DMT family transporter [Thalassobacillus hwangdonensis]|uniref:DMT family transporter n=1 Tax=Thalassobacillus hwangdonensis TaxID=546108 RepID=A0ABW3L4J1_9BACI
MTWVSLIFAGIFEMVGMFFMKKSNGFKILKPTIAAIVAAFCSFYFLSVSLLSLPVGTAYGIWTGIGSAGTVIIGIIFFKEGVDVKRLSFIGCIIVGVVGLKLVS